MKIEDLCALWPPLETDSIERGFFLGDLDDIAVGADLGRDDLAEFIEPMIRARNGEEYTASLRLPENLLAPVLASIVEKFGSSLQAIGEIEAASWQSATPIKNRADLDRSAC